MASLRGSQVIWNAASVNPSDTTTIYSKAAVVGPGPWVTLYLTADQAGTFVVQAGVNPTGIEAGRNAYNDGSLPDGGMIWFDVLDKESNAVKFTITGGQHLAIDLSPFGPQMLRLKRTDGGTTATVTAYVTAFGQN